MNTSYSNSIIPTDSEQNMAIKGRVIDESKAPIAGATLVIQGTYNGTISNELGEYSLPNVKPNDVIEVNFLGYENKTFTVTSSKETYNISLTPSLLQAEEIVVTAMGIERKAKSLTYATQSISNDEFSTAKDVNLVNSLQGKTSGLVITPNSSGAGGSSKILMRGNKSAEGNNQPLIVIDGIPMNSPQPAQQTSLHYGRDGGDALGNLNPDDIQSINLLKGASASALYGSMAANGVLMITTKKGAEGVVKVTVSSNISMESRLLGPEIQKNYGAVINNGVMEQMSWGEKLSATEASKGSNRLDDYFQIGSTYINSISISGGSDKLQNYISYANTTSTGIAPTNKFNRHNITLRESLNLFDGKVTVDASMNFIKQSVENKQGGGMYYNPYPGLYTMPNNADFNSYKNFESYNSATNRYSQNWYTDPLKNDFSANPYWVLHRNKNVSTRNRILTSTRVTWKIADWVNIQGRLSYERTDDKWDRKAYDGTSTILTPKNGQYQYESDLHEQFYGDIMVHFNKNFNDFEFNASIGSSFMEQTAHELNMDSSTPGLIFNNVFVSQNFAGPASNLIKQYQSKSRLNSVFATAQLGYKNFIYLDVTGRNDWSSTLAFTPNVSFFYPSVGLSMLVNEVADLGKVNLLKLRGSYTIVGNGVNTGITNPLNSIANGSIELNTTEPFTDLKPEKMYSLEFGVDFAAFDNKLSMDLTYYKTNNKNQLFKINAPTGTGFENYWVNAGDIQNSGVEFTASYFYGISTKLSWRTAINMSYNKNKIIELSDELPSGVKIGGMEGYDFMLNVGGSYGDIYAQKFLLDDSGNIQLSNEGVPLKTEDKEFVGNVNGDYFVGWSNEFRYDNFNLSFLIDGRIGGKTISVTEAYLDSYGTSQRSGIARDNGGIPNGNGTKIDANIYYTAVGGREGVPSEYIYNATNFRLRELTLGYTFRNLFGEYTNLSLALVARNLFFIYKDSPKDPDTSTSTSNGFSGIEIFSLPSTRNFGLKVQFNF